MKKKLILGILDNYSFHQIKKFVYSLNQSSFTGDIVFFIGPKTSKKTAQKLIDAGIQLNFFPGLDSLPEDNIAAKKYQFPQPINYFNYRHYLYYDFLVRNSSKYDWIFLTDIRDVYFQRSPFEDIPVENGLYCVLEGTDCKIADCPFNGKWINFIYGIDGLSKVGQNVISCAGTTWGSSNEIVKYLEKMLESIEKLVDASTAIDQAIHNYLIYTNQLNNVKLIGNDEGIVLTFSHETNYSITNDNKVLAKNGRFVNVLHQFDRVKELRKMTDKMYLTDTAQKYFIHQWNKTLLLGKRVKNKLKSISK